MNDELIAQRKQRAVEFLIRQRVEAKRDDQFTIREIANLMGRKDTSSLYDYMSDLVASGLWETGYALDLSTGKRMKVWWVKIE